MKIARILAFAFAFSMMFSSETFADHYGSQTREYEGVYRVEQPAMESFHKASWFLGENVVNRQREDLGSIRNLLVADNGQIKYALLDQGGLLGRDWLGRGIGDKFIAVPWTALDYDAQKSTVFLNISKNRLASAPMIDKEDLAEFEDPSWERKVHAYYGVSEEGGFEMPMTGIYTANDLMETPVKSREGKTFGQIADLLTDRDGRIEYAIVLHEPGAFGFGSSFVPIPWNRIRFDERAQTAFVDMTEMELKDAPSFHRGDWRKFDDPAWNKQVHGYYESGHHYKGHEMEKQMEKKEKKYSY